MRRFDDRVVVVTGAASGIGRALACELAAAGATLALADVDAEGLRETAALAGVDRCFTAVVDVADRAAVERFARDVVARFGAVHVVINNAGVTVSETVERLGYDDFAWLMGINFWGVVHGTKAFLPALRQADEAAIVNVSSVFGLIAFPTQGAYNASKFAVRGFTEALRQELAGTRIAVHCVHPGGIRTNILRNARFYADAHGAADHAGANEEFARIARTTPEEAARTIITGVRRGRPRILIGRDARAIDRLQRWLPVRYTRVVGALLRLSALAYARASRRPPPSNPSRLDSSSADLTTAGATSLSMRSTDKRDAGAAMASTPTTLRA
jgi:NAD(P)-dependent dehydrogenase (short-subunit alcohol dehydrogenase family)